MARKPSMTVSAKFPMRWEQSELGLWSYSWIFDGGTEVTYSLYHLRGNLYHLLGSLTYASDPDAPWDSPAEIATLTFRDYVHPDEYYDDPFPVDRRDVLISASSMKAALSQASDIVLGHILSMA